MNKKQTKRFSLVCFLTSVGVFCLNYFFYHYVTDDGITKIWHAEAGKPYVSNLISIFGVALLTASVIMFMVGALKNKD